MEYWTVTMDAQGSGGAVFAALRGLSNWVISSHASGPGSGRSVVLRSLGRALIGGSLKTTINHLPVPAPIHRWERTGELAASDFANA
jgi:hypothetical protein